MESFAGLNNIFKASNKYRPTVLEPRSGWQAINFKELKEYRDLFYFLVWRDIKVLYAQTIMGFSWAIIVPLAEILVFSIVFGHVAKVSSDGIPYPLFTTVAIIPWTYISNTVTMSSQSLIQGQHMLGKVYFPRLIFPLTPGLAKLVDFAIALIIILFVMVYYSVFPSWNLMYFPLFILMMIIVASGMGLWLSAMAIRFRDVKHGLPFAVRILMYSAPIVYSASSISENYRILYSLNPIVGVIEGFRACLLGLPFPWEFILPGMVASLVLFVSGLFYFKRVERIFVDVI